jgi:hypothetical protein
LNHGRKNEDGRTRRWQTVIARNMRMDGSAVTSDYNSQSSAIVADDFCAI